jgi:hypothetical protein
MWLCEYCRNSAALSRTQILRASLSVLRTERSPLWSRIQTDATLNQWSAAAILVNKRGSRVHQVFHISTIIGESATSG